MSSTGHRIMTMTTKQGSDIPFCMPVIGLTEFRANILISYKATGSSFVAFCGLDPKPDFECLMKDLEASGCSFYHLLTEETFEPMLLLSKYMLTIW